VDKEGDELLVSEVKRMKARMLTDLKRTYKTTQ
jgi:hypothetical protein